jgi:hypothetical protein
MSSAKKASAKKNKPSLSGDLEKLKEISDWFSLRSEIDVEEGIKKVREGAVLIKSSRERLKEIENEFEELKKELD